MSLKLRPPRVGKTPYYSLRGTHLGVRVDEESTGTSRREVAERIRRRKEADIEAGRIALPGELMFEEAAINYMEAGGERQFLVPLIGHFAGVPVKLIDQSAIDRAAAALYPKATAATRNRQVYTPVSAVLKRAGFERKIRRPIGWRGERRTVWLLKDQAFAIFRATAHIEAPPATRIEFRVLLRMLCYTGMRLGDALSLECRDIDLAAKAAYLPTTKNGRPRMAYLPDAVIKDLKKHPRGIAREGRLFRFHDGGRLRDLLEITLSAAGVSLPGRVAFHVFRHTWATWMRQHAGLDTYDLVKTDAWADPASADRYAHVTVSDVAKRAELLPVERRKRA